MKTNIPESPKEASLGQALIPFLLMIVFVIGGSTVLKLPLKFTLLLSALAAGIMAYFLGIKVPEMIDGIGKTLRKAMPAILILLAIGAIVGTWMFSGTVPYLIYFGLKLIHPDYLPVTAFIITALVSTFTGTSWGSAATAGVAFMGIAASMHVPLPLVAGAVISGAVFGDKVSPVSDTTNICAMATEISVYEHIRGMLPNVVIAGLMASVLFLIFGWMYGGVSSASGSELEIIQQLESMFNFNPIVLLPPAIVFLGGYKGYPPVVLMITSSLVAIVIGVFLNGFNLIDGTLALVSGFNLEMITSAFHMVMLAPEDREIPVTIVKLLNRGGMEDMMMNAVLYCVLAISFGSIMEQAGGIKRIMTEIFKTIRSSFGMVVAAFVSGGLLNGISGNATFSILTIGQMFRDGFVERKLPKSLLSRSMENSMTLLESLIPWHVTALFMASTLEIPTWQYAPFAFFNIAGIILFFFLSAITVKKVRRDA